jgi:hypothetical protein
MAKPSNPPSCTLGNMARLAPPVPPDLRRKGWSQNQWQLLRTTARAIASAEKEKRNWNQKADEKRVAAHRRVGIVGADAARLAASVSSLVPSSWAGDVQPIGELVKMLVEFADGTVAVNHGDQPQNMYQTELQAHTVLRRLQGQLRRRSRDVPWATLSQLVQRAGRMASLPTKGTLKSYLEKPQPGTYTDVAKLWKRNFVSVVSSLQRARCVGASALPSSHARSAFTPLLQQFVESNSNPKT